MPGPNPPRPTGDKPPTPEPDEDLPPEVKGPIHKARELLDQAERLLDDANQQDAEEMQELIDQLREAVNTRAVDDIQDVSAKLDDLVFYLQDAP